MKVKEFIMRLDNTGVDINFFGADKGLIIVFNIDTFKKALEAGVKWAEGYNSEG